MARVLNTALFLAFAGFLGPHPAPAVSRLYQPGIVYQYTYDTAVRLNELPSSGREVGYKIVGTVRVSTVWQNPADAHEKLLKIELTHAKLHVHSVHTQDHHLQAHASPLDKYSKLPAFLHWHDGRAIKLYLPDGIDDASSNLKKGVASLFQVHPNAVVVERSPQGEREEDVSGKCKVTYKGTATLVQKIKTDCRLTDPASPHHYIHPNGIQSVNVTNKAILMYELHPDTAVKNVEVRESISLSVNLWSKAAMSVEAQSRLGFVDEKQGGTVVNAANADTAVSTLARQEKSKYSAQSLVASFEPRNPCVAGNCLSLAKVVTNYKDKLKTEHIAKVKSANAFLRVLERMRVSSRKEIEEVLSHNKNKEILPQLLDASAAAQTEASIGAAFAIIKFSGDDLDIPERFLLCLSVSTHPSQFVINELLRVLESSPKNEKIKSTLLVSLGAVARTHCQVMGPEQCETSKAIQNVKSYLIKSAEKCKTESCRMMYLRGLVNFGPEEAISGLLEYAKSGGKLASIAALKALKKIGPERLGEPVVKELASIYHQLRKQYDSTARLLAIEIVFLSRTPKLRDHLKDFAYSLSNQLTPEVPTFALHKLKELVETTPRLRKALKEVAQNVTLWNWYTLAQAGDSISFSRPLAKTISLDAMYGINMETIGNGVTKRSSFDVELQTKGSNLHLMSVGLFAEGLGGLGGGDADESEEETSAGMELIIMGVRLRPYTFFTGTGELMGHVWSGTGSELTPAVQANILMLDHYQQFALHNGLVTDLNLQGAMSVDLSGSIQISLWNRNSHTMVRTSGSLLMHGAIRLDSPFAKSHVEFAMGGDSLVDFITDLDFYGKPFKSCIQMEQPAFSFRYNVRKAESVPGSKHMVRTLRKRTVNIAGKSFAMHSKNFVICANLFANS